MIAQQKYEEIRPVIEKKKRRKPTIARRLFGNPMVWLPLVTMVVCMGLSLYVGAYAGCTEKGRSGSKLMSDLTATRKENDRLKMDIAKLREPGAIEIFAKENKMQQCQQTAFLAPIERPSVAENTASNNIR